MCVCASVSVWEFSVRCVFGGFQPRLFGVLGLYSKGLGRGASEKKKKLLRVALQTYRPVTGVSRAPRAQVFRKVSLGVVLKTAVSEGVSHQMGCPPRLFRTPFLYSGDTLRTHFGQFGGQGLKGVRGHPVTGDTLVFRDTPRDTWARRGAERPL